jgi:hypothetical protein
MKELKAKQLSDIEIEELRKKWEKAYTGPWPTGRRVGTMDVDLSSERDVTTVGYINEEGQYIQCWTGSRLPTTLRRKLRALFRSPWSDVRSVARALMKFVRNSKKR